MSKGYETKGYYHTEYGEQIGETYSELRRWVVDEFGWEVWFNTKERNLILTDEVCVIAQISNELGSLIPYGIWLKNKKEIPRKEFHKWVVSYILQEDDARKKSYGSCQ